MLETCEAYAAVHNLKFSTDQNPSKCKTKTLAFLKRVRPLSQLLLCGNPLPWTNKCKHLGVTITNEIDGCESDMKIKNAMYVGKNNELNQEFKFAHPETKLTINKIYNLHLSGSPLWNLFGPGARNIESSYNRSVKVMMDLPYATHRSLIKPLTKERHLRNVLISRFLTFMELITKSKKQRIKMLMENAIKDVRSVTGANLRNIMLLMGKTSVGEIKRVDVENINYFKLDEKESWKVQCIQEIIEAKNNRVEIPGFEREELQEMLNYLCTS